MTDTLTPQTGASRKVLVIALPLLVVGTFVTLVLIALAGPAVNEPRYGPGGDDATTGNGSANANAISPMAGPDSNPGFPRTITSGDVTIIVRRPPTRIVSCTLASDELLLDLVGRNRLAAITRMAVTYPDSMIRDRVVDFPDDRLVSQVQEASERIVSWHPDLLVVASWTDPAFRAQMTRANIPVLTLPDASSLAAIRETIELLAMATGTDGPEGAGTRLLADFDLRLAAVRKSVADQPALGAVFLDANADAISSFAGGTLMDDVMEAAGYENRLRTDLDLQGWSVKMEQVFELNQNARLEVLIMPTRPPGTADPLTTLVERFPGASQLAPLQATPPRVVRIPAALASTVSHHVIRAVEHLAAARPR